MLAIVGSTNGAFSLASLHLHGQVFKSETKHAKTILRLVKPTMIANPNRILLTASGLEDSSVKLEQKKTETTPEQSMLLNP